MNVVIPMAGLGMRFVKAGFKKPKPFIDVAGSPMIERVLQNLSLKGARYILIAQEEHLDRESELVRQIRINFNVIFTKISKPTEGAACTVLHARPFINSGDPLLIANSDQIVDMSLQDFVTDCLSRRLDGSILTFRDKFKNPKWSFVDSDDKGLVVEVKEKVPISDCATVGIYFFTKGMDFVDAAIDMIIENDRVNDEFYVCPVYNYAIRSKKKIGTYAIKGEQMHGLGTPEDLEVYIKSLNNK